MENEVWEEKNLIEQEKKLPNNQTFDQNGGINEIKNEFVKKECKDIGKKRIWKRKCPKCNKDIIYINRYTFNSCKRMNRICKNCKNEFKGTREFNRTCPICNIILFYKTNYYKICADKKGSLCLSCSSKGRNKKHFDYSRICPICKNKIIYLKYDDVRANKEKPCRNCSDKLSIGRKLSDDIKKKMRISKINYIIKNNGGIRPMCNKTACEFIDKLNKEKEWNLQHALNGGEFYIKPLGYFVDGYDSNKNIVIEYDESLHYNKNGDLKEKDIRRMNEIKKYLQCKFYRYNETLKVLKEY